MDTNQDKPTRRGVMASLREEGEGYRLILDDIEGTGKDDEWRKLSLFTWKDVPKGKFDELSFDDKELADFGFMVLVRLKALVHPSPPEVIDEAQVRWGKEIQLKISKEGITQEIALKISEPFESNRKEDFFCLVSLKGLFKSNKTIYGFDAAQARELSIQFVQNILQDYEVRSQRGDLIKLDKLLG